MFFTYFTISSSTISQLMTTIGQVFTDFEPLLLLIIGLAVGIYILSKILYWFLPYTTTIKSGKAKGEHIRLSRREREFYEIDDDEGDEEEDED
jgi:hypothetical protein